MRERPVSVMVFGILNIGFALLGMVGALVSVFVLSRVHTHSNPFLDQMHNNPLYQTWMSISMPLGGIVSVALLAAGIGLLMLQNWARIVSIVYGIYSIVAGLIGLGVTFSVFMSIFSQSNNPSMKGTMIAVMFGGVFGGAIGLAYPVLLLIFMTRPRVIAAFRPEQPLTMA